MAKKKQEVKVVEVQPNPADVKELEGLEYVWDRIKAWFKRSESIFLARLTTFTGFITAAAAAIDWSPLFGLFSAGGFTRQQIIGIGATAVIQGILFEVARRRNDKVLAAVK